jgi:hypothetical protein
MGKKILICFLSAFMAGSLMLFLWSSYERINDLNTMAITKNILLLLFSVVILIKWFRCGDNLLALVTVTLLTEACGLSLQNFANMPFIDLMAGMLQLGLFVVSTVIEIVLLIFLMLRLKECKPQKNA